MSDQTDLFDCSDYEEVFDESDVLSETNKSGTIAEAAFIKEVIKLGYSVYVPIGHSTKTDLVILKNQSKPIMIQVKKATYQEKGDCYKVMNGSGKPSCATNPNDYGTRYTKYKIGDFDLFACYIEPCDSFHFKKLSDVVSKSSFRIRPGMDPMNNWIVIESYHEAVNNAQ